ncbi:MAG: hypothetical protein JRN21_01705 [Nitrososphaerota archaeon]|nr:hypothetical protein [Nitrososphaerota archaeon]
MSEAARAELVFVVDVASFTTGGFVGTTSYGGRKVNMEFDDGGEGVFLTAEMAGRIGVRKGSKAVVVLEDGAIRVHELAVAGVGKSLRVSDSTVYYGVGREGAAVLRIRKA